MAPANCSQGIPVAKFAPVEPYQPKGAAISRPFPIAMLVFVSTLTVYSNFTSQQRNFDGPLQDITAVTEGNVQPVSRHILYPYLGLAFYGSWQALGYQGDASYPLLFFNSACGALGVATFFVLLQRLTGQPGLALLIALALAFSYGYWCFTADAFYNVPALLPVILALPLLYQTAQTRTLWLRVIGALGVACLLGLAVLTTLYHIIIAPAFLAGLSWAFDEAPRNIRVTGAAVFVSGLTVFIGAGLALFGLSAGSQTWQEFTQWLQPYGGATLPMWSTFSWDRVPSGMVHILSAIVPIWRGLGLRDLSQGTLNLQKMPGQIALIMVLGILIGALCLLVRNRTRLWQEHRFSLLISTIWLGTSIPMVIWQDPFGPEHWIPSLLPLGMMTAVSLNLFASHLTRFQRRMASIAGALVVFVVAFANFVQAVWPDHHYPNPDILAAREAAQRLRVSDLIVSPSWNWTNYLETMDRPVLNLTTTSARIAGRNLAPDQVLNRLDEAIRETEARGGRVFMVDILSMDPEAWEFLQTNTGIDRESLLRYSRQPAWINRGEQIWRIRPSMP